VSATKIHWSTQTFPEFACEKKRRRYRRIACWPLDQNGNKVRWPTDAEGNML